MSSVWFKVLSSIETCMKVIQARDATLDIEVSNIEALIAEIQFLRESWDRIWNEAETVASNLDINIQIASGRTAPSRKRKRHHDEAEGTDFSELSEKEHFKINVFYVLIDSVIAGLTVRFNAAKVISSRFRFLWEYLEMSQNEMKECAKALERN